MREQTLRDFFAGQASVAELAADCEGSVERGITPEGTVVSQVRISDMEVEFGLTTAHLIKLIDAVERGDLSLEALDAICFCIHASDQFMWNADEPGSDGERLAEGLSYLGAPEIHYPLTPIVLGKIRHYLVSGELTFTEADERVPSARPHLLSETRKIFAQDV